MGAVDAREKLLSAAGPARASLLGIIKLVNVRLGKVGS